MARSFFLVCAAVFASACGTSREVDAVGTDRAAIGAAGADAAPVSTAAAPSPLPVQGTPRTPAPPPPSPLTNATHAPSITAQQSGAASDDDAGVPEGAPTPPPLDPMYTICKRVPDEWLHVEGAGSGAISGCAPRTCQGIDLAAIESVAGFYDDQYPTLDISDFAGCTSIEGDLMVQYQPGSNLSALACLERISGSLVIWRNPALQDLGGLESLAEVGGDLGIGYHLQLYSVNDALVDLDALHNLRAIGGSFQLGGSDAQPRLGAFPVLRAVRHNVDIWFGRGTHELEGMNALEIIGWQLDIYRGVTSVTGLTSLRAIDLGFVFWNESGMTELSGFPALGCIGNEIRIGGHDSWERNETLQRIAAFPVLRKIGGPVHVNANPQLERIDMFDNAELIDGTIEIESNPLLTDVSFSALTGTGRLEIHDNPSLSECAMLDLAARVQSDGGQSALIENNLACP